MPQNTLDPNSIAHERTVFGALEPVFGALELTMLAGWIHVLDYLTMRTSACSLERVALTENWNCPFKLKTDGFICHFP
jgi:hypothetical protein